MKKIAIIGNMNNNGFAMLRYFRDQDVDAHLLLFANDGVGNLNHFTPNADTWDYDVWKPFIHQMKIKNCPSTILGHYQRKNPLAWPWLLIKIAYHYCISGNWPKLRPFTKKQILLDLGDYDKYIGSGYAPAIFDHVEKKLNIFFPYALGIEFFGDMEFRGLVSKQKNKTLKKYYKEAVNRQVNGLKKTDICISIDDEKTPRNYQKIDIEPIYLNIPMVYVERSIPEEKVKHTNDVINTSSTLNHKLTLMMHSRLSWVKPSYITENEWIHQDKNSDWVFKAIATLKSEYKINVRLFVFEYGTDIQASKNLCRELNIYENVIFLPKKTRKEIMILLQNEAVDIGVGEFHEMSKIMWGGTGWEVLAAGKPLLQGFNFTDAEFSNIYGYPPPALLKVRCQNDIVNHLLDMTNDPRKKYEIGHASKVWFNEHNGIELTKKWVGLINYNNES